MRISEIEVIRADGGWRPFCFLKLSTDDDLTGWSEFVENSWSPNLGQIILSFRDNIRGEDPRQFSRLSALLHRITSFAPGGLNHQAIAAIENACLDVTAKSYGLSVASLFGGPFHECIDLYWSHCGTFRVTQPDFFEKVLNKKRLASIEDFAALGQEASARGFRCVKINPIVFESEKSPRLLNPGFVKYGLDFGKEMDETTRRLIIEQVAAIQHGLGKDVGLMIDLNFGSSVSAFKRLINGLDEQDLRWIELDLLNPAQLKEIRSGSSTPIASLESLHGRKAYLPFFEEQSTDIAIIDVIWNGLSESRKIADLSEVFEINVAPHNFYGPMADLISGQFCAATPNMSIMEIEADDVPWKYDLLTAPPVIEAGRFFLPEGPGWGAAVNEDAVDEHPWRNPRP